MRILILASLLGLLLGCSPEESAPPTREAAAGTSASEPAPPSGPRPAPEFALESLDGRVVRSEDLRGNTVVIDFWATWCPPCEFQVPELNRFWESHRDEGDVVVLGISVDVDEDDRVRDWVQEREVRYPVLLGGEELARRFGALGFPTLYVIGPDGRIELEHVGLIELSDLEDALGHLREGAGG